MFMMDPYGGFYGNSIVASVGAQILILVLALVGALLVYFLFLKRSNDGKFGGFKGWLFNFLSFRTLLIDAIIRISYIAVSIYITLLGLLSLFDGDVLSFILFPTLGNLAVRVVYEFAMLMLIICRNVSEINMKTANANHHEKHQVPSASQYQAPAAPQYQQQPVYFTAPQQSAPAQQYAPFAQSAPAAEAAAPVAEPAVEAAAPAQEAPAEAPKKKFCTNCGKEIASGSLFCTNCGTSVQ